MRRTKELKVSKSQKQIMASWILPKNERWGIFQYIKLPQSSFFGRIQDNIFFFRDFLTFSRLSVINTKLRIEKYLVELGLENRLLGSPAVPYTSPSWTVNNELRTCLASHWQHIHSFLICP